MEQTPAVTEAEALDLLTFLLTAARGLMDEPLDYGPLRLLQAAERLCSAAGPRSSTPIRDLMSRLRAEIPGQNARRNGEPQAYVRFLDEGCRSVAGVLVAYRRVREHGT